MRFKPFGPLAIGMMIVFIGAMLKIVKLPYSEPWLISGLIIEVLGIIYFIYRYLKMRKKEKLLLKMQKK